MGSGCLLVRLAFLRSDGLFLEQGLVARLAVSGLGDDARSRTLCTRKRRHTR